MGVKKLLPTYRKYNYGQNQASAFDFDEFVLDQIYESINILYNFRI